MEGSRQAQMIRRDNGRQYLWALSKVIWIPTVASTLREIGETNILEYSGYSGYSGNRIFWAINKVIWIPIFALPVREMAKNYSGIFRIFRKSHIPEIFRNIPDRNTGTALHVACHFWVAQFLTKPILMGF